MNLRDGLIPYDHLIVGEPRLPRLLARTLRLDDPPRIRPVNDALFLDGSHDIPDAMRSLEQATVDLVKYIDINKDDIAFNYGKLRRSISRRTPFDELVLGTHEWFDNFVFMRKLRNHVDIQPCFPTRNPILSLNDSGKTLAIIRGELRARIYLNWESLPHLFRIRETQQAQDYIIAAVIHQLIHAYFIVVCGSQEEEKKANELLTHGEHFGMILHKIKATCKGLPLDFGNTMPEVANYVGRHDDDGGRKFSSTRWGDQRKVTTECARDVKSIKEEDCKDWYKSKCLKALDPDVYVYSASSRSFDEKPTSKCGAKSDWVEISHDKKPYKVAKKLLGRFPTLKKKFEDTRKLDVADRVNGETFEEFICFLHEEREQYSADSLSLKMCIDLYQLAAGIKFEELKDVMFDAMYGHAMQVELANMNMDSILHVVRAVYDDSSSPDKNLRTWAKQFMKQFGTGMLRAARSDARISRLRNKRAAFRQDLDQVIQDLGPAALTSAHSPRVINAVQQGVHPQIRTASPAGMFSSYTTVAPPPTVVQHPAFQVSTHASQIPPAGYSQPYGYAALPYSTIPPAPVVDNRHRLAERAFIFEDEFGEDELSSIFGGRRTAYARERWS